MIFEHYRKWMNNLTRRDGGRVASLYGGSTPKFGHRMGTEASGNLNISPDFLDNLVEAGGIEPPSEDSPAMATTRLVRDL
jgi:hypothetical protein